VLLSEQAGDRGWGPRYDSAKVKKRLDVLLVERGLAETRSQAQALVLAGRVRGFDKAGSQIDEAEPLELVAPPRFVSRGGDKLAHALDALEVSVADEDCLDIGASTGGFTDCLLQYGARRVCAVDVGHAQLHERLLNDPRVTVLDQQNARHLEPDDLPFAPTFLTCDVSFVSVRLALPPALACASENWRALVLVKPQFEAGREHARKGVVSDPAVHRRVLREVAASAPAWGGSVAGVVDSGLRGPKGNREFFLYLVGGRETGDQQFDAWIERAVG
jgi:23S rRNA (cytidine1920-2'-O)/16S rRNA (cytidine1409-2'-O)-methyltransferase